MYTTNMIKVMLVEDDQFISDMYETKLVQSGFEVIKLNDGSAVIDKLPEVNPDILLLDLMLPNRHGFNILEEIRNIPEYETLPVIILSNENGPDIEEKAAILNAQYYLKAMTDVNELITIINESVT